MAFSTWFHWNITINTIDPVGSTVNYIAVTQLTPSANTRVTYLNTFTEPSSIHQLSSNCVFVILERSGSSIGGLGPACIAVGSVLNVSANTDQLNAPEAPLQIGVGKDGPYFSGVDGTASFGVASSHYWTMDINEVKDQLQECALGIQGQYSYEIGRAHV